MARIGAVGGAAPGDRLRERFRRRRAAAESPTTALPPYYGGTVSVEELNEPRRLPQDFDAEALTDVGSVKEYFAQRRAILDSSRPDAPGYVRFGAANWPHFGDEFVADWREFLPLDHPQRQIGPALILNGSADADETLKAAHRAIRAAMKRTGDSPTA